MAIQNLLEVARVDQQREAEVKAARARVDAAVGEYHRTRQLLARYEGRSPRHPRCASEPAIQRARDDVFKARTELHAARRALLAALQ